eukprot:1907866-Rhodomonas_salina.1
MPGDRLWATFWSKSAVTSKAEGVIFPLTATAKLAARDGSAVSWLVEWHAETPQSPSCRNWT